MLLEHTSIHDLARMLERHMDRAVWPSLTRKRASARLKQRAKRMGAWQALSKALAERDPIPALTRSLYREFQRTGVRANCDRFMGAFVGRIQQEALAVWLEHPKADLDALQDRICAVCDWPTWIMTAHEYCAVDLGSSAIGRLLAELGWMLGRRLEPEVMDRMDARIRERILEPAWDYRQLDWWATGENNWNHVCNANLITTALYQIRDARTLAAYLHPVIQRMDYALQGFADDGGCREGPSYWNYGFGHYLDAAVVLHQRTGGRLNLMADAKVERICRYPLAAHFDGRMRTTFADAGHGYLALINALKINRFYDIPELYDLTPLAARQSATAQDHRGRLDWRTLCLYNGEKASGRISQTDHFLPDLGQATLRAARCKTVLAVLAGDNGVPHNHNDIGSFILYRRGTCPLTDPGAPKYTRKTFSPERYEIVFCNSFGHSVPIINGRGQPAGARSRGALSVEGFRSNREKKAVIDMTRAYREPLLKSLVRTFVLAPNGALTLTDAYAFKRAPRSLEEAFVTFEPMRVQAGGKRVRIGKGQSALTLRCAQGAGRFSAKALKEASKEGRTDQVLTRIVFTPKPLRRTLELAFVME